MITNGGKLIRMPVAGIPTIGRNTQGVRLIRLEPEERVVAMERLAEKEEGEAVEAPEVAAARAEAQAEPLAEEDLGEEAAEGDDDGAIDDEDATDEVSDETSDSTDDGPDEDVN
jgi:DNA gyrase subunit A